MQYMQETEDNYYIVFNVVLKAATMWSFPPI